MEQQSLGLPTQDLPYGWLWLHLASDPPTLRAVRDDDVRAIEGDGTRCRVWLTTAGDWVTVSLPASAVIRRLLGED